MVVFRYNPDDDIRRLERQWETERTIENAIQYGNALVRTGRDVPKDIMSKMITHNLEINNSRWVKNTGAWLDKWPSQKGEHGLALYLSTLIEIDLTDLQHPIHDLIRLVRNANWVTTIFNTYRPETLGGYQPVRTWGLIFLSPAIFRQTRSDLIEMVNRNYYPSQVIYHHSSLPSPEEANTEVIFCGIPMEDGRKRFVTRTFDFEVQQFTTGVLTDDEITGLHDYVERIIASQWIGHSTYIRAILLPNVTMPMFCSIKAATACMMSTNRKCCLCRRPVCNDHIVNPTIVGGNIVCLDCQWQFANI